MIAVPELEVLYRPVSARLEDPAGDGPLFEARPTVAVLDIPSIARVRVEDGKRVAVQRAPGASDDDLAWLLSGPVRQIGWLQQGSMALWASAVAIGGRAVAIAGGPACGKSAVAAALALRGHPVLADEALPVVVEPSATARGAGDGLGLWPAAVEQLGLDSAAGEMGRPALEKRTYRFPSAPSAPLVAVVILEREAHRGAPATERLHAADALKAVAPNTAMAPLVEPLGLKAEHFRWITRLTAQVGVFRIEVDHHRRDLPAVADAVEALAA